MFAQPNPAPVQTPSSVDEAETLYRSALKSYLDGDYDKAIICTAQSLEKDPNFEKSKNLLTLLSAEKENEGKTVIWLAGKQTAPIQMVPPASALAPLPSSPPLSSADLSRLQAEINSARAQEDNHNRLQTLRANQLAGQFEVMHDMMSINNEGQYQELRTSQVQLNQQLQKIERGRWGGLFWFFLVSFASLGLSVVSLLTHRKKRRV